MGRALLSYCTLFAFVGASYDLIREDIGDQIGVEAYTNTLRGFVVTYDEKYPRRLAVTISHKKCTSDECKSKGIEEVIAYRYSKKGLCLIEPLKKDHQISENLITIYGIGLPMSEKELRSTYGERIALFCRNLVTITLEKSSDEKKSLLNRHKREAKNRFRGQTQTQFVTFGGGNGTAEAISKPDVSTAVVRGSNGMGSAQSQSGGSDCGDCVGPSGSSSRPSGADGGSPYGRRPGTAGGTQPGVPGYGSQPPGGGVGGISGTGGQGGRQPGAATGGVGWPGQIVSQGAGGPSAYGRPGGSVGPQGPGYGASGFGGALPGSLSPGYPSGSLPGQTGHQPTFGGPSGRGSSPGSLGQGGPQGPSYGAPGIGGAVPGSSGGPPQGQTPGFGGPSGRGSSPGSLGQGGPQGPSYGAPGIGGAVPGYSGGPSQGQTPGFGGPSASGSLPGSVGQGGPHGPGYGTPGIGESLAGPQIPGYPGGSSPGQTGHHSPNIGGPSASGVLPGQLGQAGPQQPSYGVPTIGGPGESGLGQGPWGSGQHGRPQGPSYSRPGIDGVALQGQPGAIPGYGAPGTNGVVHGTGSPGIGTQGQAGPGVSGTGGPWTSGQPTRPGQTLPEGGKVGPGYGGPGQAGKDQPTPYSPGQFYGTNIPYGAPGLDASVMRPGDTASGSVPVSPSGQYYPPSSKSKPLYPGQSLYPPSSRSKTPRPQQPYDVGGIRYPDKQSTPGYEQVGSTHGIPGVHTTQQGVSTLAPRFPAPQQSHPATYPQGTGSPGPSTPGSYGHSVPQGAHPQTHQWGPGSVPDGQARHPVTYPQGPGSSHGPSYPVIHSEPGLGAPSTPGSGQLTPYPLGPGSSSTPGSYVPSISHPGIHPQGQVPGTIHSYGSSIMQPSTYPQGANIPQPGQEEPCEDEQTSIQPQGIPSQVGGPISPGVPTGYPPIGYPGIPPAPGQHLQPGYRPPPGGQTIQPGHLPGATGGGGLPSPVSHSQYPPSGGMLRPVGLPGLPPPGGPGQTYPALGVQVLSGPSTTIPGTIGTGGFSDRPQYPPSGGAQRQPGGQIYPSQPGLLPGLQGGVGTPPGAGLPSPSRYPPSGGSQIRPGGTLHPSGSTTIPGQGYPAGQQVPGSQPGGHLVPGGQLGYPGGQQVPGGQQGYPGGQHVPGSLPGYPAGQQVPGGQPGYPGGQQIPGSQPGYPGAQHVPGGQPGYPGGHQVPGGQPGYPGGQQVPSGQQGYPGGQHVPGSLPGYPAGQQVPGGQPGYPGGQQIPGSQPGYPGGHQVPGGQPGYPGGQKVPGSQPPYPGGQQVPGGQRGYPGGQPGYPGGRQVPGGQPGYPGGQQVQGGQPGYPGGQQVPGGQPVYPGGQKVPGSQPPYPGGQQVPGGQPEYPGGQQVPGGQPGYPGGQHVPGGQPGYPGGQQVPGGQPGYPGGQQVPGGQPGYPGGQQVPGSQSAYPGGQQVPGSQPGYPRYPTRGDQPIYSGQPVSPEWYPGSVTPARLPDGQAVPAGPSQSGGQPTDCVLGAPCDDAEDSQVQTSVHQEGNDTRALSSAQGRFGSGIAQAQVSGLYSGSGSFSAQAQTSDNNKGAQVQVIGGNKGASSSAQGMGGRGKTQAQVQLGSQNGAVTAESQSGGPNYGTNTQVHAGMQGGLADAQSDGPGSTSSQAQIGFTPYQRKTAEQRNQKAPFEGGVKATAQSGRSNGQSQTEVFGSFFEGISYTGSAQAGSGGSKSKRSNSTEDAGKDKTALGLPKFGEGILQNKTVLDDGSTSFHDEELERRNSQNKVENTTSRSNPRIDKDAEIIETSENRDESEFRDGESQEDLTDTAQLKSKPIRLEADKGITTRHGSVEPAKNGLTVRQKGSRQSQAIFVGETDKKHDIHIEQGSTSVNEGDILQPGDRILGEDGFTIPSGYRGRVTSVVGDVGKTRLTNDGHAQTQSVVVKPGSGNVLYRNVKPQRQIYSPQNNGYSSPDFVTVTRSVTGQIPAGTNNKYSHTYYTKSSTCGYFTFTCNVVFGSNGRAKICKPNPPTNADGSPCSP